MKILHLLSDSRFTGPAQPVLQLAGEQLRRGHEVSIGCNRRPPTWRISKKLRGEGHFLFFARRLKNEKVGDFEKEIRKTEVPLVESLDLNRYFNIRSNIRNLTVLKRLIDQGHYDVLHLHLPHDHWIGGLANMFSGSSTNIVATMHKVERPHCGIFHKYLYTHLIDRIVTVSEKSRQMVLDTLSLHPRNVRTVWGAVDSEKFRPGLSGESIRRELSIPSEAIVVGMVARFQPHREHELLVRAAAALREKFPQAYYLFIGRGEHKETIERLVQEMHVRDRVLFAGYRREDYPEAIACMDMMFFSVPGSDGTCRAVLETMACGKPVVAFDTGVLPETIEHGGSGWIVPPGDLSALESVLREAFEDPERIGAMGRAARETICRRHTISGQAETMEEFYMDLIEEKQYLASEDYVPCKR